MKKNIRKSRSLLSWFLVSLTFIIIAFILDYLYFENHGIYGWYWIEPYTEFNFAGIFWFIGLTIIGIIIIQIIGKKYINFKN